MKKSRALVIEDKNKLNFMDLEIPKIGDYEVLFKTAYCSLCTIEQRTYKATRKFEYPFLGGHECSGEIVKVGKGVVELQPGDKAIFTASYCNQCDLCRNGKGTQCLNKKKLPKRVRFEGAMLGGGLSEYLVIPSWQVIRLNSDVNLRDASLTEPLACCIHSIEKAGIEFADKVVIVGFGIMGYFHLRLAQMKGAIVYVYEIDEKRRKLAEQYGAISIDPNDPDWNEQHSKLTETGADVIFNTVAAPGAWNDAIKLLGLYGKLVAYSSQDKSENIQISFGELHSKEYELIGTINPTILDNNKAVEIINNKLIDMNPVIDSEFTFDDGVQAFERASEINTFRVLIKY